MLAIFRSPSPSAFRFLFALSPSLTFSSFPLFCVFCLSLHSTPISNSPYSGRPPAIYSTYPWKKKKKKKTHLMKPPFANLLSKERKQLKDQIKQGFNPVPVKGLKRKYESSEQQNADALKGREGGKSETITAHLTQHL